MCDFMTLLGKLALGGFAFRDISKEAADVRRRTLIIAMRARPAAKPPNLTVRPDDAELAFGTVAVAVGYRRLQGFHSHLAIIRVNRIRHRVPSDDIVRSQTEHCATVAR